MVIIDGDSNIHMVILHIIIIILRLKYILISFHQNIDIMTEKPSNKKYECCYEVDQNIKKLFNGQTEEFTIGSVFKCDQLENLNKLQSETNLNEKDYSSNIDYKDAKVKISRTKISTYVTDSFAFFFDKNDPRLAVKAKEDEFFTNELINRSLIQRETRQLHMIRALSLRKKSSMKNKRTKEKYTARQRLHKKFIIQSKRKNYRKFRKHARNCKK